MCPGSSREAGERQEEGLGGWAASVIGGQMGPAAAGRGRFSRAHEEPGGHEGGGGLAWEGEEHGGGALVEEGRRGADGTELGGEEGAVGHF